MSAAMAQQLADWSGDDIKGSAFLRGGMSIDSDTWALNGDRLTCTDINGEWEINPNALDAIRQTAS